MSRPPCWYWKFPFEEWLVSKSTVTFENLLLEVIFTSVFSTSLAECNSWQYLVAALDAYSYMYLPPSWPPSNPLKHYQTALVHVVSCFRRGSFPSPRRRVTDKAPWQYKLQTVSCDTLLTSHHVIHISSSRSVAQPSPIKSPGNLPWKPMEARPRHYRHSHLQSIDAV